jgi:hypothetical protein
MTIVEALQAENKRTLSILTALEDSTAGRPSRREQLLRDLFVQLAGKHRAEEQVVFPLVATEPGNQQVVAEFRRESRALENLVKGLQQLPKTDPNFQLQVEAMSSRIRLLIDRERDELWPLAQAIAGPDSEDWGDRLHRGARQAQAEARH